MERGGGRGGGASSLLVPPSKKNDASPSGTFSSSPSISFKPNQPFSDSSAGNGGVGSGGAKRPVGGTTMVAGGHHVVGGDGLINTKVYNFNEYLYLNQHRSPSSPREKGQQGGGRQQGRQPHGNYPWSPPEANDHDYYHSGAGDYHWPPYGGVNGNRRVIPEVPSHGDTSSASSIYLCYSTTLWIFVFNLLSFRFLNFDVFR